VIPEDEARGRDTAERGGREEPFYVVRFKQKDLWPNYTGFDVDTELRARMDAVRARLTLQ